MNFYNLTLSDDDRDESIQENLQLSFFVIYDLLKTFPTNKSTYLSQALTCGTLLLLFLNNRLEH